MDYIRFYHLRSYDRINGPFRAPFWCFFFFWYQELTYPRAASFISQMEQNSGVKFNQARVALTRQWIGDLSGPDAGPTEVTIRVLEPTTEAIVVSDKTAVKTETIPIPATEMEARDIIERFEHGADGIRGDQEVSDNVAQHMLRDQTTLADEKWLGTEQEELDA
jgi:phospholipase D1/2